jgi:hypothetical protein
MGVLMYRAPVKRSQNQPAIRSRLSIAPSPALRIDLGTSSGLDLSEWTLDDKLIQPGEQLRGWGVGPIEAGQAIVGDYVPHAPHTDRNPPAAAADPVGGTHELIQQITESNS